jgi:hypothetical protein
MTFQSLLLRSLGITLMVGAQLNNPASAAITFLGDWAGFGTEFQLTGPQTTSIDGSPVEWVAGYGPNHWRIVQEKGLNRLVMAQDPTSPKGGAVLQVQVLPGDNVGWTGERAEVSHMLSPTGAQYEVTAANGHEVYGISIKLDPNWVPPLHDATHGNTWGIFLQLHSPDQFDSPPAFQLAVTTQFNAGLLGGDLIDTNGNRRGVNSYTLTKADLQAGHWVQFVVDVVWAYGNTGSLTVYRKDEGDVSFVSVLTQTGVPTLQFDSQLPNSQNTSTAQNATKYVHYWKTGYYRSVSPGVTSRLSLGPVIRGTSLPEVQAAAFGPTVTPNPPGAPVASH